MAELFALGYVFKAFFVRRVSWKDAQLKKLRKEKQVIIDKVKDTETFNKAQQILAKFDGAKIQTNGTDVKHRNLHSKSEQNQAQPQSIASEAKRGPPQHQKNSIQLPRPILPRERSIVEKLIDSFVGDGPNNRFALICSKCSSHNGMALAEEFEFLAFKCCYCNEFNSARRKRSVAPSLWNGNNLNSENSPNNQIRTDIADISVTQTRKKDT
ncbi:hypothetical protein Ciccas_006724 [Cichlidogyrus casuarinus]|uniref:Endoplasmic reticulum junction formation protein lunapark n=1 Tax=Cichlidogyrus casuarinus TaxID=1844966 RepID=A0ABD2Q8T4_9PLAT